MIKTRFAGVEIGADFTFFAVIAIFLALDSTGFALMSLAVCIIHEAGHLTAMLIYSRRPDSIMFRGGGIKISFDYTRGSNLKGDSVFILCAGSAVNIGLFFALYFSLPKTDIYPVMFAVLNLVIGVFNLLPIGCLDGKRLLEMFLPKKVLKAAEISALCVIATLISVALSRGGVNFTLAAAMIYILSVDIFSNLS
jgi:stage IV sporulation protein FB